MAGEHRWGSPADFARFVLRRASLAIERMELRLLGPEYKSPRLITDELMASSRFVDGMAGFLEPALKRPKRCSTSWPPAGAGSPSI